MKHRGNTESAKGSSRSLTFQEALRIRGQRGSRANGDRSPGHAVEQPPYVGKPAPRYTTQDETFKFHPLAGKPVKSSTRREFEAPTNVDEVYPKPMKFHEDRSSALKVPRGPNTPGNALEQPPANGRNRPLYEMRTRLPEPRSYDRQRAPVVEQAPGEGVLEDAWTRSPRAEELLDRALADDELLMEPHPSDDQFQDAVFGNDQFENSEYYDDHGPSNHYDAGPETDAPPVAKVLTVDRQGKLSLELVKAAADMDPAPEVLRLNRPTHLVGVVGEVNPHVIVVAPAHVTQACFRRLAQVHKAHPKIVILLSDNGKPLSAVQTADSGVRGILPAHPTRARLRSRLARAIQSAQELTEPPVPPEPVPIHKPAAPVAVEDPEWAYLEESAPAPATTTAPAPEYVPVAPPPPPVDPPISTMPAPAADPAAPPGSRIGPARVFTVASASGGSGKTFLATNLACYLAKATGGQVLLVDLDLQFGEVGASLQLRPQRTIADLLQEDDLASALADHLVKDRSGFKVLCAPRDPLEGEGIGAAQIAALLDAARAQFDFIVVDTASTINDASLAAFDQSEVLVLLASMNLPSLKHMRVLMQSLEQLQSRAGQISLMLNKAESAAGIHLDEVEAIYPQRFTAVLPYAKQVLHSTNVGVPVLQGDPTAPVSRKLAEGFMKLVPPVEGVNLPWGVGGAPKVRFPRVRKGNR